MKKEAAKPITKKNLMKKIKAMGNITKDQRNKIVCSLIGHSKIQTYYFGYYNCGRCDDQVGDSLGGVYSGEDMVIIDHNCETCRKNYLKCTWRDKLYVPDPF